MENNRAEKLIRPQKKHSMQVPKQTGFASAATHYLEPSIDLNQELVKNRDATFFVRIEGNGFSQFNIQHGDVLIVDRSLSAMTGKLAVVTEETDFTIIRISSASQTEFRLWGMITYIIHLAK